MYDPTLPSVSSPTVVYPTTSNPASPTEVNDLSSYAAQLVLEPGRDRTVIIAPSSTQLEPGMLGWASTADDVTTQNGLGFTVVSAWHKGGTPTRVRDNMLAHDRMVTRALELDPASLPTTAFAADRTWAELAVAVRNPQCALELAEEFGAPAVVSYHASGLSVIRAGDGHHIQRAPTARLSRPHQCPLLVDAQTGQLCKMTGGPWVRRSIEASSFWQIHRNLLLRTLGCTVCENGRFTTSPGSRRSATDPPAVRYR